MPQALGRPIICLVTDRRRLPDPAEDTLVRFVARAAAAGVDLVQVRERDLDDRRLLALVRRIMKTVAGTGTAVVVNDRTDVAVAGGADGVHLRGDSPDPQSVRQVVPAGFLIGRSVHGLAEALDSPAADYLVMGTIFSTESKGPNAPLAGLRGLEEVCRAVQRPVLAIGGVTADRVGDVAEAGAAGIAAIGLFSSLANAGRDRDIQLSSLIAAVRRGFDP